MDLGESLELVQYEEGHFLEIPSILNKYINKMVKGIDIHSIILKENLLNINIKITEEFLYITSQ